MELPLQHCEDFTCDSELADSNIDAFEQQSETELEDPTPVILSDNDEPSPSMYWKERAKAAAAQPIDEKWEMEEED